MYRLQALEEEQDRRAAEKLVEANSPLNRQVGGSHYQEMAIQPVEFCKANMSIEEFRASMRFNIQKYIWRDKDGIKDIEKAIHYLEIWRDAELDAKANAPTD